MLGRGGASTTIALVCLLATATAAQAATRHVVPTGGATTGDCTTVPCTLDYAAETVAVAGDVVLLASGTYDRSGSR